MLTLSVNPDDKIVFIDRKTNAQLGLVQFIGEGRAKLGFEMPHTITVLREKLLNCKDVQHDEQQR